MRKLVYILDQATKQYLAEVEFKTLIDSSDNIMEEVGGYVKAYNPVLMGEVVDQATGKVGIGSKPIFHSMALPELNIKITAWTPIPKEYERELRQVHESTLADQRMKLAGLVSAQSVPGGNGNPYVAK